MTDAPPPFTTPEMDLTGMPRISLDTERLLNSELVALSTGDEFKAAVLLWSRAWNQKPHGSLPLNEDLLASWSGARKRWPKIRDMALRGFILCADGRLYHRVLCDDVVRAWASRQTYRKRASLGGQARAQASNKHASSELESAQGGGGGVSREGEGLQAPPPSREPEADPPDPAATAAALRKTINGVNLTQVRQAIRDQSPIAVLAAYGANTTRDPGEWTREADGLQIGVLACILAWRRSIGEPIREPSGLRSCRKAWRENLTADERKGWGRSIEAMLNEPPP